MNEMTNIAREDLKNVNGGQDAGETGCVDYPPMGPSGGSWLDRIGSGGTVGNPIGKPIGRPRPGGPTIFNPTGQDPFGSRVPR